MGTLWRWYDLKTSCATLLACSLLNSNLPASPSENELSTGVVSELQREYILSELIFFLLPFHRAAAAQRKNVLLNVGLTSHQEN